VHLVDSYFTDISRCTVNKTLKMLLSFLLVIFGKYVRGKRRKKERERKKERKKERTSNPYH